MAQANLPISFWGDALLTATYILNKVPSKSVSSTPYELLIGYVFIGELENGSVSEIESRDVTFLENNFPKKGEVKNREPLYEMLNSYSQQVSFDTVDNQIDQDLILDPSGSGNSQSQNPSNEPKFQLQKSASKNIPKCTYEIEDYIFLVSPIEMDEPKSVTEALSSPGKDEWMKETKEELKSMKTNKVWDLVDLLPGHRAIGNKWVLKVKCKADGSIERYKA
ncbi:uncharacterized protein LOC142182297 [Nicotiana tabacum]|uniref:Uncharacterized protein LOC142182297 n=1 Tax=Nicotiana tabacum TaxID=4097 RepID=A0AC58USY9_TOBAC